MRKSLLFLAVLVVMWEVGDGTLVTSYSFNRTCVVCGQCKDSANGPMCLVIKGGPYDTQRWQFQTTCTSQNVCNYFYPQLIRISNNSICSPIQTSCYRQNTFANAQQTYNCTSDQKLCSFDPNHDHTKFIAIVAVCAAVALVLAIGGFLLLRYKCGRKKFSKEEKFQVFREDY